MKLAGFALVLFLSVVVGSSAQETAAPAPSKIGNGVSAPVVVSAPNPQYTNEARAEKVSGSVLVQVQVSEDGLPTNVRVVRGIGYGLDEKAIEAVKQYRFKPAMKDGQPVKVAMNIQVNFQIF